LKVFMFVYYIIYEEGEIIKRKRKRSFTDRFLHWEKNQSSHCIKVSLPLFFFAFLFFCLCLVSLLRVVVLLLYSDMMVCGVSITFGSMIQPDCECSRIKKINKNTKTKKASQLCIYIYI